MPGIYEGQPVMPPQTGGNDGGGMPQGGGINPFTEYYMSRSGYGQADQTFAAIQGLERQLMEAQMKGASPMVIGQLQLQIQQMKQGASRNAQMEMMKRRQRAYGAPTMGINGRGGQPNPTHMNAADMIGAAYGFARGGGGMDY